MTSGAAELYRALAPAVLGYLRSQRAPDPEDLLGEVFLQVARDLPRYRGDEDGLRPWVFAIARHRLLDARRRASRRPVPSHEGLPEVADPRGESVDPVDPGLAAAVAQLTPEQREVVALRFIADLSLEEVARLTGRKAGAVKAMQHRALAQLARILGPAPGAVAGDD